MGRLRARMARSGTDQAFHVHVAVAQQALGSALSVLGRAAKGERGRLLFRAIDILDSTGHLAPSYDTDTDLQEVRGRLRALLENPEVLGEDETEPRAHLAQALAHLDQARVAGIDVQVDKARHALQRALETPARRIEARRARTATQSFRLALQLVEKVLAMAAVNPELVIETSRQPRPRPQMVAGGDRR